MAAHPELAVSQSSLAASNWATTVRPLLRPRGLKDQTCVLCNNAPASRQGEHVLPRWFLEAFPPQTGRFTTYTGAKRSRKPDGTIRPPQEVFSRVLLPVCAGKHGCNGRLERNFERTAKPIVRRLWQGRLSLSESEAFDFAVWVLKTWLLTAHPARVISDPGWDEALAKWDPDASPDDLYRWTVTDPHRPPDGLSVWLTKTDPETRAGETTNRIPLPTVKADGGRTRFSVFACGMDFLDAGFLDLHLVYHPGWPIEHPLELAGRAARLWPRTSSAPLDLGTLPVVADGQVSWYEGPTVHFASGSFKGVARPPLSIETPLELFPMPPGATMVTRG